MYVPTIPHSLLLYGQVNEHLVLKIRDAGSASNVGPQHSVEREHILFRMNFLMIRNSKNQCEGFIVSK